jgi:uncharacterized damage-inducible protein DinB
VYNLVYASHYEPYVQLVISKDARKALRKNTDEFLEFLGSIPEDKIDYAYAEGKWTIKQVLQHVIDAERIFAYRALRIARLDTTPLPSFDEDSYAANANVAIRGWQDMLKEFRQVRKSNLRMISGFTDEQLNAQGIASNDAVSVVALCFIMAGHARHHANIIKERYLQS